MSMLHPLVAPLWCGILSHAISHYRPPSSNPEFLLVLFGPPSVLKYALPTSSFVLSLILYLFALGSSIAVYRSSPLHPLARYPGPAFAKVSRLWAIRTCMTGKQHLVAEELFDKYGDVVRTGPDHLIMRDASAVPVVLGAKNPWPKHPRYAVARPYDSAGSVLTILDPAEHNQRRRIWDRGFSATALKSYEPMLDARVSQLSAALEGRVGEPVDLAQWIGFMTLDFMGDFSLNGQFDFLARGEDAAGFHEFIIKAVTRLELLGAIPWIRPFVLALPRVGLKAFQEFSLRVVKSRIENGSKYRDIFYYLLNEDGEGSHAPLTLKSLTTEASLAIIAGSDTTSAALANAIVYLLANPYHLTRLRAELDAAAGEGAVYDVDIEADKLAHLEYLQAIINETLRLMPAMPHGAQRMPPQDGGAVLVAGHVVPVGTTVQIPTWSLHRDPRYFFPDPNAFWPERWLPKEGPQLSKARGQEFKLNLGAYIPFNYGPGNCAGRSLALHEIRTVLSILLRRFDIQFAPGFGQDEWTAQLRDVGGLVCGKLMVVLEKRA